MNRLYIVMYHYVRDLSRSRYPDIKGLDVALFQQQVAFFKEHFAPVTMEQVIATTEGKETLPEGAVLLTFDDGYSDHYRYVLPVLEEAGIQGSFFIPGKVIDTGQMLEVNKIHHIFACAGTKELLADLQTQMDYYRGREYDYPSNTALYETYGVPNRYDDGDVRFIKTMLQTVLPEMLRIQITDDLFRKYVDAPESELAEDLYLSREEVADMKARGMFIGVHGYEHGWLADMTPEEVLKDTQNALDVLADFLDREKWVMNYPYGNYSTEVAGACFAQGAVLGLTVEPRVAVIGDRRAAESDDLMLLPRLDCNDFPPKSEQYLQF